MEEALSREDLNDLIESGIHQQREFLENERREWQERLGEGLDWLEGADQLVLGSWDLLAVKVLWPVG